MLDAATEDDLTADYFDRLGRIQEKIARLRERDKERAFFGAHSHRYRLAPTVSEPELSGWEGRYGVRLPGEYRAFLRRVGNGGCGPAYGLERFGWLDTPDDRPKARPTGREVTLLDAPH